MRNYTPLDLDRFSTKQQSKKDLAIFNTVLLLLATLTAAVLAMLLFVLIKKSGQ